MPASLYRSSKISKARNAAILTATSNTQSFVFLSASCRIPIINKRSPKADKTDPVISRSFGEAVLGISHRKLVSQNTDDTLFPVKLSLFHRSIYRSALLLQQQESCHPLRKFCQICQRKAPRRRHLTAVRSLESSHLAGFISPALSERIYVVISHHLPRSLHRILYDRIEYR